MSTDNSPSHLIREAENYLSGIAPKTSEKQIRWLTVAVLRLARGVALRAQEYAKLRQSLSHAFNRIKQLEKELAETEWEDE